MDDPFGLSVGVHVGGVDGVDPPVICGLQERQSLERGRMVGMGEDKLEELGRDLDEPLLPR